LYGNKEVVAPISAPILQMVAIPKIQLKKITCSNRRGEADNLIAICEPIV
jgi:hypothetical protein